MWESRAVFCGTPQCIRKSFFTKSVENKFYFMKPFLGLLCMIFFFHKRIRSYKQNLIRSKFSSQNCDLMKLKFPGETEICLFVLINSYNVSLVLI